MLPEDIDTWSEQDVVAYLEDIDTWSEQDVVAYLEDNPEMAAEFELLLFLPSPRGFEGGLIKGLAQYHAGKLDDGLDNDPDRDTLALIEQGTTGLRAIDAWVASGEQLTPGQVAYYEHWYDEVGADNLAALSGHVGEAIHSTMLGVPAADEQEYIDGQRSRYLSPIANGIMHLSNPDIGGTDSLSAMPRAIQELATTEIGRTADEYGNEIGRIFDIQDGKVVSPRLDRFVGFAELMDASTVRGGDHFTAELGVQAIRVQQELNEILGNAQPEPDFRVYVEYFWDLPVEEDHEVFDFPSETLIADLRDQLDTVTGEGGSGVSTLLSVVGRNDTASSALLLDPDDRVTLLGESWKDVDIDSRPMLFGFDWADDAGAADVIRAGTDRGLPEGPNPGQGGTELQARVAWNRYNEISYYDRPSPEESRWQDDDDARELLYGRAGVARDYLPTDLGT